MNIRNGLIGHIEGVTAIPDIVWRLRDWSEGPDTHLLTDEAADVIERLRAEVEALRTRLAETQFDLRSASEGMQRYARDAERYRWLRDHRASNFNPWGGKILRGAEYDAAIDAAREKP